MNRAEGNSKNILEESALHHLMVFFQKAEALPTFAILLIQIVAALLVAAAWRLAGAPAAAAWVAAGAVGLATLVDALFLRWLPKARISFGPWKAQTVVLLTPRAALGAVLALVGTLASWPAAIVLAAAAQLSGLLLLWWAAAVEPRRLGLTRLEARLDAIPPGSRPFKILHISDIHLERITEREEQLLSLVRREQPDLIALTGDYLNLSYNCDLVAQEQLAKLLRQLEAPAGVFATLGSPPADRREVVVPLLEKLPLQLLRNDWACVEMEWGRPLVVMGVDCTHNIAFDAARLEQVVESSPDGAPRILLYHSPELMPQAMEHGIDLYLCGHTHGGQVRLPLIGPLLTSSKLGRRYVMGLYQEGKTRLYVSRGVGLEGLSAPRARLLAPPEITLVTLLPQERSPTP